MTPGTYQEQIEMLQQEANRYGKLAEYYRGQIDKVKRLAIVSVATLVIIMIVALIFLPKPRPSQLMSGGEQVPLMLVLGH
jgi:hypothetical protein